MDKPKHITGVYDDPKSFVRFTAISSHTGINVITVAYDDTRPVGKQYQLWDYTQSTPVLPVEYCDVFGEKLEWDEVDEQLQKIVLEILK